MQERGAVIKLSYPLLVKCYETVYPLISNIEI